MSQYSEQWAAGTLALLTIVRGMIDGGDPARLREFIRWLTPDDVVQTEHLFILAALKTVERDGGELSRDRLNAALEEIEPAYFARLVLDNLVECRDEGARDDKAFDKLMSKLEKLRAKSARESLKASRAAAEVARKILAHKLGVIEGARKLFDADDPYPFMGNVPDIFSRVALAAREFPEGGQRKHWAPEALIRKDAERRQFEADAWPEIERACKELVNRWGS